MQPGFFVSVLPCVTQGLLYQGVVLTDVETAGGLVFDLPKRAVMACPAQMSFFVRYLQRRAVQIGVKPEDVCCCSGDRLIQSRQRAPDIVRIIKVSLPCAALLLFLQQTVTLPQEAGGDGFVMEANRFAGTATQRILAEANVSLHAVEGLAYHLYGTVEGVISL